MRDEQDPDYRVEDRRHWVDSETLDDDQTSAAPSKPTFLEECRQRAEEAERRLQEYVAAFKRQQEEQEQFRLRLSRDVERKAELRFGELVAPLLELADDLERALGHAQGVPQAQPLVQGVSIARDRFLSTLQRQGIEAIVPAAGDEFDPNEAEAVRMDPVTDEALNGRVTETLRAGYRLGDLVVRPARVAVGRRLTRDS
jgi:molecular chaperone GrpE